LDPFIGSGSSAIAALNTNRKIIGIDSKKEYLDFCVERIEKHTKTQDIASDLEGFIK
jgi:DNA modification methylase